MFIYQMERWLLQKQVKELGHHVTGDTLDVGSGGFNRYQNLFKTTKYVRSDVFPGEEVDVVASGDNLPFKDGEFDSIVSTQVLEHVKFPEKVVREMNRVLKVGGKALITVPQWNELHNEPDDYWRYTKYGMDELFGRNGFSVVEKLQRGGYYANRAQMAQRYYIDLFRLYERPLLGRVANLYFRAWGAFAMYLDSVDTSVANRKHAIGWSYVFQKNENSPA